MRVRGTALSRVTATFDAGTVAYGPPRLGDAADWSAARIADEERLRPAFGEPGVDWSQQQSELAFVERCLRLRLASARGLAVPGLLRLTGPAGTRVFGEVGLDSIDRRTGTGELSSWSGAAAGRGRMIAWATAVLLLHAFTMPTPLRRVVAPQVTSNSALPRSLTVFDAVAEMTFTKHRLYEDRLADHRIWVLHNTFATCEALRAAVLR